MSECGMLNLVALSQPAPMILKIGNRIIMGEQDV